MRKLSLHSQTQKDLFWYLQNSPCAKAPETQFLLAFMLQQKEETRLKTHILDELDRCLKYEMWPNVKQLGEISRRLSFCLLASPQQPTALFGLDEIGLLRSVSQDPS